MDKIFFYFILKIEYIIIIYLFIIPINKAASFTFFYITKIIIIFAFEGLEEELKITTKINNKKQNLKVDVYDVKNKIVYQFQGCYYHGCPRCYKPDDIQGGPKVR